MCIDGREAMTWWTADPLSIASVVIPSAIYLRGLRALRASAGPDHGIRGIEVGSFFAGQLALLVALVSPVDRLSDILFSAHMTQHEIIMLVAPPLIVLGRPWVPAMWALPPQIRARVGHALVRRGLLRLWRGFSVPLATVLLHGLVVWIWHVPELFEAALRSEAVHAVQHASFFATAALFWWAILRGRYGRLGYGLAVAFVFVTAMHTSLLGALITMASSVWYPLYATRGEPWAVDVPEDQALAGIVMWVPSGVLLTLVALALFACWLGEAGRRVELARRRMACATLARRGA
jgi:putative membrane protein